MSDFKEVKWLLFDLDNTLLNFSESSHMAFRQMLTDWSVDAKDASRLYDIYQKINHQLWHDREEGRISHHDLKTKRWSLFFKEVGITADAGEANAQYFDIIQNRVDFVPYAQELLSALKPHYQLSIVTNGLSEVQRPRIERSGIGDFFEHIIISDEIGTAKPQNAFFEHCHDLIDKPDHREVLIIGDTLKSDIKGGNDFGYHTCWFNHDYIDHDGLHHPNAEINTLPELLDILSF